jgi:RNA polymerase sigma-70 factor, ECF subfamily
LDPLPDDELLDRYFAATDAKVRGACVQELFRRHYPKVVSWCLRFAGNRDEAYDLAQAVFTKAHRHLAAFRRDARFTTWLYAIVRSEGMNFLDAKRNRPAPVDEQELAEVVDDGATGAHEALERAASGEWVKALLDRVLDETEKQVFTLHFGDEVPLDAITRLLGLTNRSGAKAYVVSARRKLERALRGSKSPDQSLDA